MKIFKNISLSIVLLQGLTKIKTCKKNIHLAKEENDFKKEMKYILEAENTYTKYVVDRLGLNIEIEGYDNLPDNGPVLFVSNHQSYFDILIAIYALRKFPFGYIAKESTNKIPFFKSWLEDVKCLFIKRENAKEALKLVKEAGELFKKGYSMYIFPEGTRGDSEEITEFKPGAFKFATKHKVPIIPITLIGTRKLYEEKGCFDKQDTKIIIHKPIETKDLTKEEEKQMIKDVETIIRNSAS